MLLPAVRAAVPSQSIWQGLGKGWALINPAAVYQQGNPAAHVIDAILLFIIIFVSVFDIARSKVGGRQFPKSVAAAMGLIVWLPLVIYLNANGQLLLTNIWTVSASIIILTLNVALLFQKYAASLGKTTKRWKILSFLLALGVVGAGMTGFLQRAIATSATEQSVKGWMTYIYGMGWPLALIFGLGMLLLSATGGYALGRQDRMRDVASKSDDAEKRARKERRQRNKEGKKDDKFLKRAERIETEASADAASLRAQDRGLGQRLQVLRVQLQDLSDHVKSYAEWKRKNKHDLPSNYKDSLVAAAKSWETLLQSFEEDVEKFATTLKKEANTIASNVKINLDELHTRRQQLEGTKANIDSIRNDVESIRRDAAKALAAAAKVKQRSVQAQDEEGSLAEYFKNNTNDLRKFANLADSQRGIIEEQERAVATYDTDAQRLDSAMRQVESTERLVRNAENDIGEMLDEVVKDVRSAREDIRNGLENVRVSRTQNAVRAIDKAIATVAKTNQLASRQSEAAQNAENVIEEQERAWDQFSTIDDGLIGKLLNAAERAKELFIASDLVEEIFDGALILEERLKQLRIAMEYNKKDHRGEWFKRQQVATKVLNDARSEISRKLEAVIRRAARKQTTVEMANTLREMRALAEGLIAAVTQDEGAVRRDALAKLKAVRAAV